MQGHETAIAHMGVEPGLLLLTMDQIGGVIKIQDDHLWRFGLGGDKLLNEDFGQMVQRLPADPVFKARHGRLRSQVGPGLRSPAPVSGARPRSQEPGPRAA